MANNLLAAADVFRVIGSVILAILILLLMITVHEFGHYLAGKLLHFKIDEFSIGFGPALFKRKRKKSGEIFAIRLLPLGGYCSFHGEDGREDPPPEEPFRELSESGETLIVTPPTESASEKKAVAEPAAEEKTTVAEPVAEEKTAEPAPKRKKRDWNDDGTFSHMKPWKRILVLVAGAFMNYLTAFLLILICFSVYGGDFIVVRGVSLVGEDGTEYAQEYSFREGDILLGADGRDLYLTTDLSRAVNGKKKGDLVVFRVARLQEDGSYRETEQPVMLRSGVSLRNSADFKGVFGALGVGIEEHSDGARYYMVSNTGYRFGFFETIGHSFVYSFKIAGSIFRVIGELFTGKLGLTALGGPVTTISTTASVASQSFRGFLEIAGFIGVNLAVFNLLPIPALDGSKVVFTAIEWIRGKPISRKIESAIHAVGFVLLIGFAILVDILQFL